MNNWNVYRLLLRLLPPRGRVSEGSLPPGASPEKILRAHRCLGASLCLFDETGVTGFCAFGVSHRDGTPVTGETVFRAASVSKFVTALGAMKLREQGKIDLDRDVGDYLPAFLMDAWRPERPVTLRGLLTHTAGVRDSGGYNAGIARGVPLSEILRD